MIRLASALAAIAAIATIPARAQADDGEPSELAAPFATLDRLDGASVVNLQMTYPATKSSSPFIGSSTILGFEADARYVDPASHVGGYVSVPLDYIGGASTPIGDTQSTTAFGGVELGALYARSSSTTGLGEILHVGLVLPTASKDDYLTNAIAIAATRPRDLVQAIPGASLRLGASPVYRRGQVFARGDVDLDINLSNRAGDTTRPVLTVAGGVGVQTSAVALTVEVNVTHPFDDNTSGNNKSTLFDLALSVRLTSGAVHPYVALVLPLDSDSRDAYDFAITGGLAAAIR